MSGEYQLPDQGHIEMQQELLRSLQQEISGRLFASGAASRIMEAKPPTMGAKVNVDGVAQLDSLFVPTLANKKVDGRNERILELAIIGERGTGYTTLGEIDEQGFMHVLPGVPEKDAWTIYAEAQGLESLKTGTDNEPPTLPNLANNLLMIINPYQAMYRPDGK